ncbi:MAG: LodA/GoxA family CTQ-dependent oxidase [Roseiflexaceae bacterium]
MTSRYAIHPRIGVARVGNSPHEFYLGPERTGGLPIECDQHGNPVVVDGHVQHVRRFKDAAGAIKRQAARFSVMAHDEDGVREVSPGQGEVVSITWTAHLANKKAVWYNFAELQGDLTLGLWNSYEKQHIPLRNPSVQGKDRQRYIIDPGPRSVSEPGQHVEFSRYNIPATYPHGSFPDPSLNSGIDSLGALKMDHSGRLILLGGFGKAGGQGDITSFAGANNWFDDISDGYVLATLTLADGSTVDLEPAWVIVGSPKYAPELVNIVTLDDCIYDIAVRKQGYDPELFNPEVYGTQSEGGYDPFAGFNPDFRPNYRRDIEPIIKRPLSYRWVAQVPSMIDFASPGFDTADPSEENRARRERYFSYYRVPVPHEHFALINTVKNGPNQLLAPDGLPLMPLNSGDNSITNTLVCKFLTLTPTQYFFMHQWAQGKFTTDAAPPHNRAGVIELDRQVIGNCVGGPFAPGIETTWIVRNPLIYSAPFQLKVAHWQGSTAELETYYAANGLSTTSDPDTGRGSEPGDLTKRMAIPWQADFADCTIQTPNIANPHINQGPDGSGIEIPPSYYVYWWPPQSPMQVVTGSLDPAEQVLDGYVSNPITLIPTTNGGGSYQLQSTFTITPAGQTVLYQRGVLNFVQMVQSWQDLGFIVNKGNEVYDYFVESERNTVFLAQGVASGSK